LPPILTAYLRSSSAGAFDFCQMQAYLTYVLGLGPDEENGWERPEPGCKADQGSLVHKALELLACRKLADQNGEATFKDDETGASFGPGHPTVEEAFKTSWDYYSRVLSHWDWNEGRKQDCWRWTQDALSLSSGLFDPRNRTVLWPEKRFDIVMDQPWARYEYDIPGWPKVQGQLCLKGTVDLVCAMDGDPESVELVDWKTGQRKDWATGKMKEYSSLSHDFQLRLYHYALCKLLPAVKNVFITIVFVRDGGAFSIPFSRSDLPETERMIRDRFFAMKQCELPKLESDDPRGEFKCRKLCFAGRNSFPGETRTVCKQVADELLEIGMARVTAKFGDPKRAVSYGSGGGRSEANSAASKEA